MDRWGKKQIAMIAEQLEEVCVWSSGHILQPFLLAPRLLGSCFSGQLARHKMSVSGLCLPDWWPHRGAVWGGGETAPDWLHHMPARGNSGPETGPASQHNTVL